MFFQKSWKRAKRVLAVVIAATLFFSGWGNYDFAVLAAGELAVTLSEESAVDTGDEPKPLTEAMLSVVNPAVAHGENQNVDMTVKDGDTTIDREDITVSYTDAPTDPLTYEGNTFRNDVYAGDVVVKPASGYKISDSETGSYMESITYTESQTEGKVYLQNTSNHFISEATHKAFMTDRTVPSNLTAVCAEENGWKQRKTISVSVTEKESDCALYYAETDVLGDIHMLNSLPEGLREIPVTKSGALFFGSFSVTENIGTTAKTYYIYAMDDAGNVAKISVDVSRIETGNPVISVDDTMENYEAGVYWKNSNILEIPISVCDIAEASSGVQSMEFVSGIQSIEMYPGEGANIECTYQPGDKFAEGILKVAEPGDYTIKVTDQAGNTESKTITVKQDTMAPIITLGTPEGSDRYYDTHTDIYWFSNGSIKVSVAIIDTTGDSETGKAPYEVIFSTFQDMSDAKTLEIISDEGTAELTLPKEGTEVTYYFQVKDRARNVGTVRSITLAYDATEPIIAEAELPQLHGDEWINHEEFHSESGVKFSVTATDQISDTEKGSGIGRIEYSSDNGEHYKEAADSEENGVYTFTSVDTYEDGVDYQWKVRVTDNVGRQREYALSGGKIDTTTPSTTAYMKFFSDTEGANDGNRGSVTDGKWISHIYQMAKNAWNKIWGKTTVKFEVYVQDVTSGIDTISMSYVSSELSDCPILSGSPAFSLTKVEGLKAFSEGDTNADEASDHASGYTVFEGEITCMEADGLAIRNFRIDSLTDAAGNTTTEKIVLGNAEGIDIIYLDTTAPVLSVVICDDDSTNSNFETDILTKEKYFYNNSKKMVLTIDERFFGQENTPVYPTVTLLCRENSEDPFAIADTVSTWTQIEGTTKWQTGILLPEVPGKEMEYQVTMSAYQDPSGNALAGDAFVNNAVSSGAFQSKIYVVDALSPKLVDYHVSDSTVCRNQGIPIYKNNLAENDLTVTFVIDDQEEYYRQSKDQLSVKVYRNQEENPVLSLTEEELQKEFDGRNHRYSFGYDGAEDTEDAYYVEISYEDEVGNSLIDGRPDEAEGTGDSGTIQNGIYTSGKYIIDHVAPEFHAEFSDANNVVKDGVSDAGKKPLSDHLSYYNGDIQVQLTFNEKYVEKNTDGSLQHFQLELYKDGASVPLAGDGLTNVISDITWSQEGTIHTVEFILKADPINHTTDGNYRIVVKYRDCSENPMIPAKDEQGNLLNPDLKNLMSTGTDEDTDSQVGIYTSPVLVLDTTKPAVETFYSEDPVKTSGGTEYFNHTNATFEIRVTDRNIRYGELKKELGNLRAYDIDGTEITGSALEEAVENIEETGVQCAAGNADAQEWTLQLPLSTEANYEIPVDFTDLAGNQAVVNQDASHYTEKVTVDATPVNEEIYIQFESDVQGANDMTADEQKESWISELLQFISEQWNRIWGREVIRFRIYVRDEISGVENLTMSYYADQVAIVLSSEEQTLVRAEETITLGDGKKYVVYSGSITLNINEADNLSVMQFQIDEAVDMSQNKREHLWFAGTEFNQQIYLDHKAPELLGVTIDQVPVVSEGRYYYQESKQVVLTLEERFLGKEKTPVYPKVAVSSRKTGENGTTAEFAADTNCTVGSWTYIGDEKWQATVELPARTREEIEYLLTIDGYQDGAGHALTGTNVTDGCFTSKIIVIDTLAPELREFAVTANGEIPLEYDEGLYFAKNIEGDDVKLTAAIDDHAAYFNPENVKVYYKTEADEAWNLFEDRSVSWKNDENNARLHTAVYTFDGAGNEEHTYQFKITYADRARNSIINNGSAVEEIFEENGAFISNQKVVIDHSAPKMTRLVFDTPVQIFDGETNKDNGNPAKVNGVNVVTDKNSRVYFDANAKICFDMEDTYLKAADLRVNIYQRADKLEDFHDTNGAVPKQSYSGTELAKDHEFEFTMPAEDAEYYFTISYTDRAGNQMVYDPKIETKNNAAYDVGIRNDTDTYVSPIMIRDTSAPVCEVAYTVDEAASDLSGYYYRVNAVEAFVNVTEMNLDMEATRIHVTAEDINGNIISCNEVEKYNGVNSDRGKSWAEVAADNQQKAEAARGLDGKLDQRSLRLRFETEARYTVRIEVVDKLKKDVVHEKTFCIDRTVPGITVVDTNGHHFNEVVKAGLLDESASDITYSVVNDGAFAHMINKLTFGYFAKEKIRVQIKVHDRISGVETITYTCTDSDRDEEMKTVYRQGTAAGPDSETFRTDEKDQGCAVFQFDLPISFRGTVKAYGADKAGNSAEATPGGAIGVISETSGKHQETSKATLEILSKSPKTKDYYNEDIRIRFTSQDSYSGLYLIDYLAGNDLQETVSYGDAGEEIITSEISRDYLIRASSNNENNIKLGLRLEDLAGHETKVPEEQLPKIHIDITKPVVKVEYDNLDVLNEKYYKDDRIATVTVTERNFDPEDVRFELEGPEVSVSEWSHVAGAGCSASGDPLDTKHTDFCSWVCQVHFSEDGDYVFGFRCVDLAGNEGVYEQVDEFTIDKTIPKISVEYDNNSFLNEYYFKEARTATITIEEHNFSADDVEITMTAKDDGNVIQNPGISGWVEAGDFHKATIRYIYDGEFTFDITYKDLAGNEAEDYEPDYFIVDLTAPELEIFDIEDNSANNGEVSPGIRYFDTNYDPEGTVILMKGYHTGTVEMPGEIKLQAKGMELKLEDFAYEPEMDDLYTMEAIVYDLAGNSSEANVRFSVNRFGSVYTFDEATDALIGDSGRYYTNKEQELVITETNVDTLEFQEITCNLNGKLRTLKEGQDYSVDLHGGDGTWKQYTYTIGAHNFTEEGTYILTIYSEDRANNASDNNSKGKRMEFVVDKTKPSIIISGVENNGQYRANSREMTLNVEDNVRLSEVSVSIDGKETVFDAAKIYEADGTFAMEIGSTNQWQEIAVTVLDAAGNEESVDDLRVLVTANMLVQFYQNTKLFYGSLAVVMVAGGILFFRKRKKG